MTIRGKSWLVVWLEHGCSSESFAASRHQRLKLEPADRGPGAILLIQLDQWQQWHSLILWSNSFYLHWWSGASLVVILQQSRGPQGHLASRSAGSNSTSQNTTQREKLMHLFDLVIIFLPFTACSSVAPTALLLHMLNNKPIVII